MSPRVSKVQAAAYYRRRAESTGRRDPDRAAGFLRTAVMLEDELHAAGSCRNCGRPLENPVSRRRGFGNDCYRDPAVRARFGIEADDRSGSGYSGLQPETPANPKKDGIDMAPDTNTAADVKSAGADKPALHDNCPKCGFKFPKPQAECRSAQACKRRQEGGGRTTPAGTRPRGDARKAGAVAKVTDLNARLQAARDAKAAKAGGAVAETTDDVRPSEAAMAALEVDEAKPRKVHLTSPSMEAFVDGVLPGDAGLRSGRAGHWLLIQPGEGVQVVALFDAANKAAPKGPAARTAFTVFQRVVEALDVTA